VAAAFGRKAARGYRDSEPCAHQEMKKNRADYSERVIICVLHRVQIDTRRPGAKVSSLAMRGDGVKKLKKIHAMLYAIEQDPAIVKTVLMKYIFFIDLIHYNQRGGLLFDSTYIRMPNGPVDGEALALASETNRYFSVRQERKKYTSRSKTYTPHSFRVKVPCDLSLFSPYEQGLMAMVLASLKGCQARTVSNLTHELRLWKEFSDGDTISLDYFNLTDDEIALLERNGLQIDGFQRTFCRTMMGIAQENADAIHPLNAARVAAVEQVLDDLIRRYPLPALEMFYDAYLAWDDAFRSALRIDPGRAPRLTATCCDAVCYVSSAAYAGEGQSARVRAYCEEIEDEFNAVAVDLAREEPFTVDMTAGDLLDRTMRLSRSLAQEMPSSGRR
jgi:hypothetical protein